MPSASASARASLEALGSTKVSSMRPPELSTYSSSWSIRRLFAICTTPRSTWPVKKALTRNRSSSPDTVRIPIGLGA